MPKLIKLQYNVVPSINLYLITFILYIEDEKELRSAHNLEFTVHIYIYTVKIYISRILGLQ